MFGPHPHADCARHQMLNAGYLHDRFQLPRRDGWARVPEDSLHPVVRIDLELLRHAGRKLAPPLHPVLQIFGDGDFAQRIPKQVCRGHRVLNREVDAHAPGGRHGVRGIADAQ